MNQLDIKLEYLLEGEIIKKTIIEIAISNTKCKYQKKENYIKTSWTKDRGKPDTALNRYN